VGHALGSGSTNVTGVMHPALLPARSGFFPRALALAKNLLIVISMAVLPISVCGSHAEDVPSNERSASSPGQDDKGPPDGSPSTPTHPSIGQPKGEEPGDVIPEGGKIDEMTRPRTIDDTVRDIMRDKRPQP
jgi:hypothetical protein